MRALAVLLVVAAAVGAADHETFPIIQRWTAMSEGGDFSSIAFNPIAGGPNNVYACSHEGDDMFCDAYDATTGVRLFHLESSDYYRSKAGLAFGTENIFFLSSNITDYYLNIVNGTGFALPLSPQPLSATVSPSRAKDCIIVARTAGIVGVQTSADFQIFNASTGERLAGYTVNGMTTSPVLVAETTSHGHQGALFAFGTQQYLIALEYSLETKELKQAWQVQCGELSARPVALRGAVYAPLFDGSLHALWGTTGEFMWTIPMHMKRMIRGAMTYTGYLILLTYHHVIVVDPSQTGSIVYAIRINDGAAGFQAEVSPDGVLCTSSYQSIRAFNVSTGESLWNFTAHGDLITIPPVFSHGVLYSQGGNGILGLSAYHGVELFHIKTTGILSCDSLHVRDNNTVYYALTDGKLHCDTVKGAQDIPMHRVPAADSGPYPRRPVPDISHVKHYIWVIGVVVGVCVPIALVVVFKHKQKDTYEYEQINEGQF